MVMMISASILLIGCGFFCLKETDMAWQLFEWDCRLMNITPPRIANWRERVKRVGYGLIGMGILGFLISIGI
jgi:hypothetical protein